MKFIFDCVRSRSRYRGTIAAMYYRLKSGMGHELLNLQCLSWLTDKTFFLPPTVLNYPFSHHFSKSSHWFISHFSLPYYVSLWTGSFRLEWPMKQTDSISISTLWLIGNESSCLNTEMCSFTNTENTSMCSSSNMNHFVFGFPTLINKLIIFLLYTKMDFTRS